MKKTKALLSAAVASVMLISAIGFPAAAEEDYAELNVMIETPVESLDPGLAMDGTSLEVIGCFTDGLMQMDAEGSPIPAIAESYDVSDDGLTYTFYLRQDAYWSNGTPVTADDFVFAWQRVADPDTGAEYAYMLSDCAQIVNAQAIMDGEMDKSELGVTAIDDYTLEVNLEVPVSFFVGLMYFPTFYPVNEEFFNTCPDTYATSPDTMLSNGAFIMDDYQPSAVSFHLTKNADYYDADRIQLSGLNYQLIQDSQQALMSYDSGDLDITLINGDQVEQVEGRDDFSTYGAGYLWYIAPNMDNEYLANQNIRLALSYAIDREAITENVTMDGSTPAYTAVPQDFAAGPDGSDFSEDQDRFKDICDSDADKALEYWNAGLEELGVDEISLTLAVDSDDAPQKVAAVLQQQWESTLPGLSITINVQLKSQRIDDMQNGDFDMGLTRWGPDYADPYTYLGMWVTGNSYNYGNWSNEEYDAIIEECTTGDLCTDAEGRWERLYDAEELVLEEGVIFPLYTQFNAIMTSPNVSGIEYHAVALNRVFKDTVKTVD